MALLFMAVGFRDPTQSPPVPAATAEAEESSSSPTTIRQKLTRLDLPSALLIIPSITCLLLALQWGGTTQSWSSPLIITLFASFGTLLLLFGYLQSRLGDNATIPLRLLKNRNLLAGAWFQACCDGTLAITEYYIAIYFQGVRGFSAAKSGALGLPMIVGLMVSMLLAGWGTGKVGYYARKYSFLLPFDSFHS